MMSKQEDVNHPNYYQNNGIEVMDVIRDYPFNLGNAVKYLVRAGKKEISSELKDLKKARNYINDYLEHFDRDADLYYTPIPTNYRLMAKGLKYEETLLLICIGGRTNFYRATDKVCIKKALNIIDRWINMLSKQNKPQSKKDIVQRVADLFGISIEQIKGRQRDYEFILARHLAAYLLRKEGLTLQAIGKKLNRNHSSIILYLEHFKDDYVLDKKFKQMVNKYNEKWQ